MAALQQFHLDKALRTAFYHYDIMLILTSALYLPIQPRAWQHMAGLLPSQQVYCWPSSREGQPLGTGLTGQHQFPFPPLPSKRKHGSEVQ